MKKNNVADEWISYAESDFDVAKFGKVSVRVKNETLCFFCQQVAEKSIKAVCVWYEIKFPKTHNIEFLLKLLKKNNINIPKLVMESNRLSDYAVLTRYPGDHDEIKTKEYKAALKIAENCLKWAKSVTTKDKNKLL